MWNIFTCILSLIRLLQDKIDNAYYLFLSNIASNVHVHHHENDLIM